MLLRGRPRAPAFSMQDYAVSACKTCGATQVNLRHPQNRQTACRFRSREGLGTGCNSKHPLAPSPLQHVVLVPHRGLQLLAAAAVHRPEVDGSTGRRMRRRPPGPSPRRRRECCAPPPPWRLGIRSREILVAAGGAIGLSRCSWCRLPCPSCHGALGAASTSPSLDGWEHCVSSRVELGGRSRRTRRIVGEAARKDSVLQSCVSIHAVQAGGYGLPGNTHAYPRYSRMLPRASSCRG
jgi:hypothetical protein